MDLYKRQQFEFLLQTAVERLAEKLEQRHRGSESALQSLQQGNSNGLIVDFVEAIFQDFLLDNIDGACFILSAIPQRRLGQPVSLCADQSIQSTLVQFAKQQFHLLLQAKTLEALEQHAGYQAVDAGGH